MIIESQNSFKELLRVQYIVLLRQPSFLFIIALALAIILGTISGSYFENIPAASTIIVCIGAMLFHPVSLYIKLRAIFKKSPLASQKMTYEFTDDKLSVRSEGYYSELAWNKVTKIMELRNWIFIYFGKAGGFSIKKSAFGNNLAEFKQMIRAKSIKHIKRNY